MTAPPALRGRRIEWIGTVLIIAVAVWYWLQYFNRGTNLLDEGSTAAQALRILRGDLIYRDFFTVVTPLSYYTIAALFQVFGEQLMVMRWAALVTGVGVALVAMIVARRVCAWPFAAAAGLLTTVWGWFLVTPNFYSLEAALFALIAVACYLRGPSARWMLCAGLATGVTAMTKQNVGAYTALGLLMAIWVSMIYDTRMVRRARLKTSGVFVAGICLAVLPILLWLLASGAGPYLYESWVYYPLVKYTARFARPFPDFYPISTEPFDLWTKLVIYLPVVVYPLALVAIAVLAYRARRYRDAEAAGEGRALVAIALVGLLTLLQAWPRADVPHILFGLQGTFIVFAYLLSCAWRAVQLLPGPRHVYAAVALPIALAPALLLLWNGYQRTNWEYQNYIVAVRTERATGIFTAALEAQRIDVVTRYIADHSAPDDWVFVVPWASGFNFLANRANPTRADFLLFEDPELYPCLLSRLDERPPAYVIYGYTWDVDERRFREYAAPIDQYIRSRYATEFTTDGYEVWKRRDDVPQAAGGYPRACQPRRFRISDLVNR